MGLARETGCLHAVSADQELLALLARSGSRPLCQDAASPLRRKADTQAPSHKASGQVTQGDPESLPEGMF